MIASGPVLITGCSSGIGRATAQHLVKAGYPVYATARRPGTLDDLREAGAKTLALDVTDEDSMAAAVKTVEQEHGQVGTLINNAGYGAYGPVEEVSIAEARREFETNVFGLGRMCQLVLPGMRTAGGGCIVNISSMGGRITFPAGGWYHASKYAVEALSDALRIEVAGFGIQVVLVEPGLIRTEFGSVASGGLTGAGTDGPYAKLRSAADAITEQNYQSRLAAGPDSVAKTVQRAMESAHPRARYLVTPAAKVFVQAKRFGGDRLWDTVARRTFRM